MIFNSARCPECNEDDVIPLANLTGTFMEMDRQLRRCLRLDANLPVAVLVKFR
jgi:hypothetical protein